MLVLGTGKIPISNKKHPVNGERTMFQVSVLCVTIPRSWTLARVCHCVIVTCGFLDSVFTRVPRFNVCVFSAIRWAFRRFCYFGDGGLTTSVFFCILLRLFTMLGMC